jgi:TonB family protein
MKSLRIFLLATTIFFLVLMHATLHSQPLKIVRLKQPAYPIIALAARVSGKVDIKIILLADGTPADVQIVSGPPMLQRAAMDSARGSRFEFDKNSMSETSYIVSYVFLLASGDCDQKPYSIPPTFKYDSNTVTITGTAPMICDPSAVKLRSLKCLYLWRCSTK